MPSRTRHADRNAAILVGAVAITGYCLTADRGVGSGDSAEMQLAASSLGIAHPPGYAIQIVAGRLFACLPSAVGSQALRVVLLSVVCAAATLSLLLLTLRRLDLRLSTAMAAVLMLGASDLFWRHARTSEVYAPHAAMIAVALYAAAARLERDSRGLRWIQWLALGAACVTRPTFILAVPAFAALHERRFGVAQSTTGEPVKRADDPPPAGARAGSLLTALACFAAPFAASFAYIVIRDGPGTTFNYLAEYERSHWNNGPHRGLPAGNDTCSGRARRAVWLMTAAQYRAHGIATFDQQVEAARHYGGRLAWRDLSALAAPLILLGCLRLRRRPRVLLLFAWMWISDTAACLLMPAWDRYTFVLPGLMALAALAAAGGDALLRAAPRMNGPIRVALFVPGVLLVLANLPTNNGGDPARLYEECVRAQSDPVFGTEPIFARRVVEGLALHDLPVESRLFCTYVDGRALQALLWLERGRGDVQFIVHDNDAQWRALWRAMDDGRPAFALDRDRLTPMERFQPAAP